MEKQFDVLVVGELNVDLILNTIDKFPEIGKEVLAHHMTLTLGSSSAIFASNLSTLGTNVTYAGKIGLDNFGDHILSSLHGKGVDTSNIIHTPHHNTGATIVLNFSEDRAMVTYPGAMSHLTLEDISTEKLLQARHLHLSSIFLQQGIRKDIVTLFRQAKTLGLTTSIDPQWDPSETWDLDLKALLPHVDIFMPNTAELKALTGIADLQEALAYIREFGNAFVVKNGGEGAYLWDGQSLFHQRAFLNTSVVDSIGAGDSFDAGFIHKFLQQRSWQECLEFGALTGAINTTRHGGTGAFENLNLVKTIAQTTFNYTL
jgi:sugar/nucleoside kinase (ribokinase family)